MEKGFLLLEDFQQYFNMLTDEEAGQLIKWIFTYVITGEEPEFSDRAMMMAFYNIKRFLDSSKENYKKTCQRRSESAKKRWSSSQEKKAEENNNSMQNNANACKCIKADAFAGNDNDNVNSNANANVNDIDNVNSNVNVNVNVNDNNKKRNSAQAEPDGLSSVTNTQKKGFGEFKNVFLSQEEYLKLRKNFPDADERIESLSAYMKAKGKVYRDHYAELINWQLYGKASHSAKEGFSAKKMPGERREPTFDVSLFTNKAVGIKYEPPQ